MSVFSRFSVAALVFTGSVAAAAYAAHDSRVYGAITGAAAGLTEQLLTAGTMMAGERHIEDPSFATEYEKLYTDRLEPAASVTHVEVIGGWAFPADRPPRSRGPRGVQARSLDEDDNDREKRLDPASDDTGRSGCVGRAQGGDASAAGGSAGRAPAGACVRCSTTALLPRGSLTPGRVPRQCGAVVRRGRGCTRHGLNTRGLAPPQSGRSCPLRGAPLRNGPSCPVRTTATLRNTARARCKICSPCHGNNGSGGPGRGGNCQRSGHWCR